jgi:hypothetical protein
MRCYYFYIVDGQRVAEDEHGMELAGLIAAP